ncbi:transcriptional regulator GcvA [Pseudorhodoplanes sp.]|uniref:transcriptional regulator GcvA n=1 Tax=Pseudorhodoplanes sp. TaxID=1934341 RepID=UPI002CD53F55|nr:transcriptional regulator GcvA [Pseudorhodoplanes sp.]HWV54644.1 transcriptional regulator GcvA [Pseudorhodoplanes sp.]
MHGIPPLNALRAFEASARHLSLTKAAQELNVTPGAISHQLRGLEELLRVKLFERGVRKIALTPAGKMLYPGIQRGFAHISDAVADLKQSTSQQVLVVSTSPGLTSKWLVPRLYRFTSEHPDIDVRISSSLQNANFTTDGVHIAVRNMPIDGVSDSSLVIERLFEIKLVPVCSPRLIDAKGSMPTPHALAKMPLIHDDTLAQRITIPTWADWFRAAKVGKIDLGRGLHFDSPDHALNAATEGAGVLLAPDILAYDDLRTGRLVIPVPLAVSSGRAYHLVFPKRERRRRAVEAFSGWIKNEAAKLDPSYQLR